MFIRKYVRRRADGSSDTHLAIARTYRQGKRVYQQEVCRLGRLEELQASGQINRLIQGLARFSQRRWVMGDETSSLPQRLP